MILQAEGSRTKSQSRAGPDNVSGLTGDLPHTKLISQRNHQQGSGEPEANPLCYPEFPLPGGEKEGSRETQTWPLDKVVLD